MNNSPSHQWEQYLERTKTNPPRPQLLKALEFFENPPTEVLELGGGALNDAQYLLSLGARVTVVDAEPGAKTIADKIDDDMLQVYTSRFDEHTFPAETYDFVTSLYALSFNPPETFHEMIKNVQLSLKKGGIFSGNIFGPKDDWSERESMTFLTPHEVKELFSDMEILSFEDVERDNILAGGQPKHWHEIRIIAKN